MTLNPIIPEYKSLIEKLWEFVQPNSTYQIDLELENQEYIYFKECCYNLPIDAYTTPSLHLLCQSVEERLHITDKVIYQVDNREFITGSSSVSGNNKYPSVVSLSAGAVNTLNENELSFLIGHELGHVISHDGLVRFFFSKLSPQAKVPRNILHDMHVLDLLAELEADRFGYLACGSIDAFISVMFRLAGGIDMNKFGVSTSTFLNANRHHVKKFMNGGWLGKRHPANALRIEAIRLFATCKTNRELQAQMKPIIDSIINCDD